MKIIELKILPKYYDEVILKHKTFEVRKNDRDYKIGDILVLKEWINNSYTDRYCMVEIKYICDNVDMMQIDYSLAATGYVILGIELIEDIN